MEHRWDDSDRRKPKHAERNMSQCNFVHHESHVDWSDLNPDLRGDRLAINRLR